MLKHTPIISGLIKRVGTALLVLPLATVTVHASAFSRVSIRLIEPFDGNTTLTCNPSAGVFACWIAYWLTAISWVFDIAVGICIIWMLASGLRIIISGDNTQLRSSAITQMKASAIGLMLLIFGGPILRAINDIGFT